MSDPGPADVALSASQYRIDSGDRTEVRATIDNPRADNFVVKIKFPTGLTYVADSSYLDLDGELYDTGPINNAASSDGNYLVYYLSTDDFLDSNRLILAFELVGVAPIKGGRIAVDIDLDDPDVRNSLEFDVSNPLFSTKYDIGIDVEG